MYKKLFIVLFAVIMTFTFVSISTAQNHFGYGDMNIGAEANAGAIDSDVKYIPGVGIAGGISGAYGTGQAEADGSIYNGTISGDVTAVGGGLTTTDAYRWTPKDGSGDPLGNRRIGVGSSSFSQAVTGASANITVDPGNDGDGYTEASIKGFAAQGTLNGSYLVEGQSFKSDGFTSGIAGQGSIGCFYGSAGVDSDADHEEWCTGGEDGDAGYYIKTHGDKNIGEIKYFANGHPQPQGNNEWLFLGTNKIDAVDSYASADIGANINMFGDSYSESYRFVGWDSGVSRTEGMGTFVGANTTVISSGYADTDCNGSGNAYADVNGGWFVVGGAASYTTQDAPGFGGAEATAVGYYVGAGGLNTNFNGSVNGYTGTSVTTFNGMNGSINSAHAGMSVSNNVSSNDPN